MSLVTQLTAAFQQVAATFKYLLFIPVKPTVAGRYSLQLSGGVYSWRSKAARAVTANAAVALTDDVILAAGGNITITLPAATAVEVGRVFEVARAATGTKTINGGGTNIESLTGTFAATTTLANFNLLGAKVAFISNGALWYRLNNG